MPETSRRDALADAALVVLADQGGRGLTHRAVDRAVGVAEGTTSYYFRTRKALLQAAVQRLAAVDTAAVDALPDASPAELANALADLVDQLTRGQSAREIARLELALEGRRDGELRQVLTRLGEVVHRALSEKLTATGIEDPQRRASAVLVLIDGVLVDRLSAPAERVRTRVQLQAMMAAAVGCD